VNDAPQDKGSYALALRVDNMVEVEIGRLGRAYFPAGFYLYLGSALGTGGWEPAYATISAAPFRRAGTSIGFGCTPA